MGVVLLILSVLNHESAILGPFGRVGVGGGVDLCLVTGSKVETQRDGWVWEAVGWFLI